MSGHRRSSGRSQPEKYAPASLGKCPERDSGQHVVYSTLHQRPSSTNPSSYEGQIGADQPKGPKDVMEQNRAPLILRLCEVRSQFLPREERRCLLARWANAPLCRAQRLGNLSNPSLQTSVTTIARILSLLSMPSESYSHCSPPSSGDVSTR